MNIVSK